MWRYLWDRHKAGLFLGAAFLLVVVPFVWDAIYFSAPKVTLPNNLVEAQMSALQGEIVQILYNPNSGCYRDRKCTYRLILQANQAKLQEANNKAFDAKINIEAANRLLKEEEQN